MLISIFFVFNFFCQIFISAVNKYGSDVTKASIECFGKSGVYYDSLQPESLARIRELESAYAGQQSAVPSTPTGEAPKFTTQIVDITKLVEGQSAHFEAKITPITDPDLVVEWYYNGRKLPHGHRYRTFHDFGIVILDILYCYEENSGVYECRAGMELSIFSVFRFSFYFFFYIRSK